jgi:hypothetical protein
MLCRRWSCPPSVALAEDARYLRMYSVLALGRPGEEEGGDAGWPEMS